MKKRVDVLLAERGLAKSREKAKALIIAGSICANGMMVKSPAEQYDEDVVLEVKADACPYVSRGGLKLRRAVREFGLDLNGKVCADIGASTGGFTDCMLQNGAAFVYAVDVGYGQLDWKLRNDARVEVWERTNARYLEPFAKNVDFVSADVSFISLALIFPAMIGFGNLDMQVVTLIKPQFEAGREKVGKKGVVRDPRVHVEVIQKVRDQALLHQLYMRRINYSPIKGPNGNIEYLALYERREDEVVTDEEITEMVNIANESL